METIGDILDTLPHRIGRCSTPGRKPTSSSATTPPSPVFP